MIVTCWIVFSPLLILYSGKKSNTGWSIFSINPLSSAIPTSNARDFCPGLCLKTTLYGGYSNLPSIYTKQCEWAEQNGYENNGPLYEVYITDPTQTSNEDDLVTEIYYPVKKK